MGSAKTVLGTAIALLLLVSQLPHSAATEITSPAQLEATPGALYGELTNLRSNTDEMFSYRFERHCWETSDGVLHLVTRTRKSVPSLQLVSSADAACTQFVEISEFELSGKDSTCDGVLSNDDLYLVYNTDDGGVTFVQSRYSIQGREWSTITASEVYRSTTRVGRACKPSIALEQGGRIWISYIIEKDAAYATKSSFALVYSDDLGRTWSQPQVSLPPAKSTTERSLRLLASTDMVYAIYSDDGRFSYATHSQLGAFPHEWTDHGVFFERQAKEDQADPNGAHFSATVDLAGNIHFVTNDAQYSGVYMNYQFQTADWSSPLLFTSNSAEMHAAYMQIATDGWNNALALFSAKIGRTPCLVAYASNDGGQTWIEKYVLSQQGGKTTGNPRIEMSEHLGSSQVVFQQTNEATGKRQSAIRYLLPID
jgi:hypothetical protein